MTDSSSSQIFRREAQRENVEDGERVLQDAIATGRPNWLGKYFPE